jgi:hypothetical protein
VARWGDGTGCVAEGRGGENGNEDGYADEFVLDGWVVVLPKRMGGEDGKG